MPALRHRARILPRPGTVAAGAARARSRAVVVTAAIGLGAALIAGCGHAQASGPQLTVFSAQVSEPNSAGITDAYLVIQNTGAAVKLTGAQTSAGGSVALRSPAAVGTVAMRTVAAITVPAHSLFRLSPNGSHLLITRSGPMTAGREITLTLTFARIGSISVPAMVTNPQTGGSSYFLN
jgi:copper(I)-binding protein